MRPCKIMFVLIMCSFIIIAATLVLLDQDTSRVQAEQGAFREDCQAEITRLQAEIDDLQYRLTMVNSMLDAVADDVVMLVHRKNLEDGKH